MKLAIETKQTFPMLRIWRQVADIAGLAKELIFEKPAVTILTYKSSVASSFSVVKAIFQLLNSTRMVVHKTPTPVQLRFNNTFAGAAAN